MKTSVIPVFLPHIGCPYRCIFCNQWKITGHQGMPAREEIKKQIDEYTASAKDERYWELAFYGGSFTALPEPVQNEWLALAQDALEKKKIQAIRLSTRPDCMDHDIAARLASYGVTIVELGVQSMDDAVLRMAKRGHTAEDVRRAVSVLKEFPFSVGLQFMPGLPGETEESFRYTIREIAALQPDFVRIYPVVLIEDTELEILYREKKYTPLTVAQAVPMAAWAKEELAAYGIRSVRTGLQATEELDQGTSVIGGAYHPAFGELADSWRYRTKLAAALDAMKPSGEHVTIFYHRQDTSKIRGRKNGTVKRFCLRYGNRILWKEDNTISPGMCRIIGEEERILIKLD